jgi:hypothetical protein
MYCADVTFSVFIKRALCVFGLKVLINNMDNNNSLNALIQAVDTHFDNNAIPTSANINHMPNINKKKRVHPFSNNTKIKNNGMKKVKTSSQNISSPGQLISSTVFVNINDEPSHIPPMLLQNHNVHINESEKENTPPSNIR